MKKVNIVIGRFQPFTKGHYSCVDAAAQLQMISRHNHRNFDEANFLKIFATGYLILALNILRQETFNKCNIARYIYKYWTRAKMDISQ